MISTVVTFLTTRIVAVVITIVVAVAAVPSLIILIHGNTITIATGQVASSVRHGDDEERARLIIQVKTAGHDVIVLLNDEEARCDSQIAQLAKVTKLTAAQTTAAILKGKSKFHLRAADYVREVESDENEFEHLAVISTETEQVFLARILQIRITALGGDGSTTGVLITVCQTIIIEIRKIVITVVITGGGTEDDD